MRKSRKPAHGKEPCNCSHGKSIHYTALVDGARLSPCHYPKCKCPKYRPAKS
jgi:hypothetical protein